MAKIFVQFRKGSAYLEEQAQADSNVVWKDYSDSLPIILPNGKKLFPLNSVSKYLKSLELSECPGCYSTTNNTLDQIESMVKLLDHDNGNSSGTVDLPQEVIDQIRSVLEPAGLATFTEITA